MKRILMMGIIACLSLNCFAQAQKQSTDRTKEVCDNRNYNGTEAAKKSEGPCLDKKGPGDGIAKAAEKAAFDHAKKSVSESNTQAASDNRNNGGNQGNGGNQKNASQGNAGNNSGPSCSTGKCSENDLKKAQAINNQFRTK